MKTCLLLIASISLLVSCSPVLYTPVGQNVPFFKKKGEVMLTAGMGGSDNTSEVSGSNSARGFTAQGGIAVSEDIAVIAGFNTMRDMEEADAEIKGRGNYFEVGIGKYKYWPSVKLFGDVSIGTGIGQIKNQVNGESVEVKFVKPFIQPSIGYGNSIVDFAFTPKIVLINHTSTQNGLSDPVQHATVQDYFDKKKSSLVMEPGFTVRLGYQNFRLQFQGCYTGLSYPQTEEFSPINNFYSSLMLYVKFNAAKKQQN